jgi:diguanylate cyclase
MLKEFYNKRVGHFSIVRSSPERFDFEILKKITKPIRGWLTHTFSINGSSSDPRTFSLMVERIHRALLERQLVITQVALAKACTDLVESKEQAQHFRFQSLHDSLTTLPNSLSIHECLEESLRDLSEKMASLAILFIDIDDFKSINDRHGHLVGDEVLQIVSARIQHAVRTDDRVGRLGGDEFLCLIGNESSRDNVSKIAIQILEAVREPIQIGLLKIIVQSSIGIAFSPLDASASDDLIKRADSAMYRTKRLKTGYQFFDPSLDIDHGLNTN